MSHPIVVTLVENGTTEITVPGERTLVTQVGGDLTEVLQPVPPVVVTLLSQGFEGDVVAYVDAAAASAAAALQSELNASDSELIEVGENLFAGALVNIYYAPEAMARLADASTYGKEAMGFVSSAVLTGGVARVFASGNNTHVTGLVPGPQFLSTAPGLATQTSPDSSGNIVQRVGFASRANNLNFQSHPPVTLS
jgi:hypothetical protein